MNLFAFLHVNEIHNNLCRWIYTFTIFTIAHHLIAWLVCLCKLADWNSGGFSGVHNQTFSVYQLASLLYLPDFQCLPLRILWQTIFCLSISNMLNREADAHILNFVCCHTFSLSSQTQNRSELGHHFINMIGVDLWNPQLIRFVVW